MDAQTVAVYTKHRTAKKHNYDQARKWSGEKGGHAQYDPHKYGSDEAVKIAETNCVEKGILIEQTENVRTYYKKLDHTVGVCSGEFTDYIYAEWHDGGPVHGRPISVKALEIMQVKL